MSNVGEGQGFPPATPRHDKFYLGDGVYVVVSTEYALVLTTENGLDVTNRIVLEPNVYRALVQYVKALAR